MFLFYILVVLSPEMLYEFGESQMVSYLIRRGGALSLHFLTSAWTPLVVSYQYGTLPWGLKPKMAAISRRVRIMGPTSKSNVLEKLFQNINVEASRDDSIFKSVRLNEWHRRYHYYFSSYWIRVPYLSPNHASSAIPYRLIIGKESFDIGILIVPAWGIRTFE